MPFHLGEHVRYTANDVNESTIKMWRALQKGWKLPKYCTKDRYLRLRNDGPTSAPSGYIGHCYSYASIYFGGWVGDYAPVPSFEKTRRRINNMTQTMKAFDVNFQHGDYKTLSHVHNSVIYCDPPYSNTRNMYFQEYKNNVRRQYPFNTQEFITWCKQMREQNNIIFVSEYDLPAPFVSIWSSKHQAYSRGRQNGKLEQLFVLP